MIHLSLLSKPSSFGERSNYRISPHRICQFAQYFTVNFISSRYGARYCPVIGQRMPFSQTDATSSRNPYYLLETLTAWYFWSVEVYRKSPLIEILASLLNKSIYSLSSVDRPGHACTSCCHPRLCLLNGLSLPKREEIYFLDLIRH